MLWKKNYLQVLICLWVWMVKYSFCCCGIEDMLIVSSGCGLCNDSMIGGRCWLTVWEFGLSLLFCHLFWIGETDYDVVSKCIKGRSLATRSTRTGCYVSPWNLLLGIRSSGAIEDFIAMPMKIIIMNYCSTLYWFCCALICGIEL